MAFSLPTSLFLTLIGLVMGSFLGTLVMRLPEGRPVIIARSSCDHCGMHLAPWQLLPLLGYLAQWGKCSGCGAKLSFYYVLFELAGVAVALWAGLLATGPLFWATAIFGWLLLALALMDFRTLHLSDVLVLALLLGGAVAAWCFDRANLLDHLIGIFTGWCVLTLVGLAYRILRGRNGLGTGDARLLGAIGAWTRWDGLASVVLIGCAAALLFVLMQSLSGRIWRLESKLPFGSFLCAGAWIVWLYGPLLG